MKQIIFDDEAREQLQNGVEKLTKAVVSTLGPGGHNVVLKKYARTPLSTKDGVTVAKHVYLDDALENMGAEMVKEAAIRTNDMAGDGTTTSTLLAYNMLKLANGLGKGKKVFGGREFKMVDVAKGMEMATAMIVDEIKANSVKTTVENILDIATISANNDLAIGKVIYEAYRKKGLECVITAESAKGTDVELELSDGMEINKGWYDMGFVTNRVNMTALYKDANVLLTDLEVSDSVALAEGINATIESGKDTKPLIIFARDFLGEALSSLLMNRNKHNMPVLCVQLPGNDIEETEYLEDLAAITGASIISEKEGLRMHEVKARHLGKVKQIESFHNKTTIIGYEENEKAVEDHAKDILARITSTNDDSVVRRLRRRASRLTSGVAVIKIGGNSELEIKEKKDRFIDAISAASASVKEGILPGGGTAYLKIVDELSGRFEAHNDDSVKMGMAIVSDAAKECIKTILHNTGKNKKEIASIIEDVRSDSGLFYGYNAKTGEFGNLLTQGVIDPAMVTRVALQNAVSVAMTMIMTNAVIYYEDDEKEKEFKHQTSEI